MRGRAIVLDTTVLVARPIHQLLGTLGADGGLDVVWSEALLRELVDVLKRPLKLGGRGRSAAIAEAVAGYVRDGFPSGAVPTHELAKHLEAAAKLVTDAGDAHVVALALAAGAGVLVTANAADYIHPMLLAAGIEVVPPDAFLMQLYASIPEDVISAVERQVDGRSAFPATVHDLLSLLSRAGCSTFATHVCAELRLPRPDPKRYVEGRSAGWTSPRSARTRREPER